MAPAPVAAPRVVVVGMGPAGPELVPPATIDVVRGAARCLLRTARHPAAAAVVDVAPGRVASLDHHYDEGATFADVYRAMVEDVVSAATEVAAGARGAGGAHDARGAAGAAPYLAYVVPGSPVVAERTVDLLRSDDRVSLEVLLAPSFLDLAWARLGVDPVDAGVRLVDGTDFAVQAAGERGPLLVAQCHRRDVLSEIKLAADDPLGGDARRRAVLLHHLGLPDERVIAVPWAELDRTIEPDHLTSVYVPDLAPPLAAELARLDGLVRTLRERCPWDRLQTHGSLARHLLEEAYEALDAIEAVATAEPDVPPAAVAHLEEELGDLVFQVYFHARLASEQGWFTLADVARVLHDKLVARHPHVFGDVAAHTPEDVASRWEQIKKTEKRRSSVTEGIPAALPALALAAKLQRKAESVGLRAPPLGERLAEVREGLDRLTAVGAGRGAGSSGETLDATPETAATVGDALFALADAARRLGVDPEAALRARAAVYRDAVREAEATGSR